MALAVEEQESKLLAEEYGLQQADLWNLDDTTNHGTYKLRLNLCLESLFVAPQLTAVN